MGDQFIAHSQAHVQSVTGPRVAGAVRWEPEGFQPAEAKLAASRAATDERSSYGLGTSPITVTTPDRSAFNAAWREATDEKRLRYEVLGINSHWHASRARGLKTSPLEKECDAQQFVSCGCKAFPVGGCRSKLCRDCNSRRWGQVRRRVLRAVRAQGGAKWRMMTMAGPPRDTPEESMQALQLAWARMRAWLYKRWRRAFDFVLVFEIGTRNAKETGKPHVHMHCLAKFPGFVDYGSAGEQWVRAYPGAVTGGLHFSKRDVYKDGQKTGKKTTIFTPESGAYYIAKYATKGFELLDLPPQLAARTMAAMVGKRIVRASQGFWTIPCDRCEDCGWKYGLAVKHRAISLAHEIYNNQRKRPPDRGRQVAADARPAVPSGAGCKWASPRELAEVEWARGSVSPRVLVETAGKVLDRLAPGHRQTWVDGTAAKRSKPGQTIHG